MQRVRRLETEARRHEETMASYGEIHAELDRRAEKLESELEAVRRDRLEAYNHWWAARESHNRALHLAGRLRRRLRRCLRRRRQRGLDCGGAVELG
jgi:hypothetical protein